MSMWRCPHCGTPQPETARCWVCHRSSTTCSTCRHFRRAVAGQLGYCGLDRRRAPLAGSEHRGCWEAAAAEPVEPDEPVRIHALTDATRDPASRLRDFVPVRLARDADGPRARSPVRPDPVGTVPVTEPTSGRVTLFAELDAP